MWKISDNQASNELSYKLKTKPKLFQKHGDPVKKGERLGNHWTEQADLVTPFLDSDQQPPLSIAHLAGPKAVQKGVNVIDLYEQLFYNHLV